MEIQIREARQSDVPHAARIIFDAFAYIQDKYSFPRDFPTIDVATGLAGRWVAHPSIWAIVAEVDGKVVGFNGLDQRGEIAAVGPVVVDPAGHGKGVGRAMMKAVLERAGSMKGVRLIQEAFNSASLSLYASLGFEVKEPVSVMGGSVKDARKPDGFRLMTNSDLDRCAKLCMKVHGIHRSNELADAVRMFEPVVLERGGRIVAYASAPKAWLISHSMGETQADFEALIEGLCAMRGEVLLFVPTRQAAMFRWCLSRGLRVLKPATLMSMGEYQEPRGTWTPSVLY